MALVVYGTFRAVTNPTNTARVVQSGAAVVQEVVLGTIDIIKGVCYRRGDIALTGVKHLGYATAALGDTVVYTAAVVIPLVPIGLFWSRIRGQR